MNSMPVSLKLASTCGGEETIKNQRCRVHTSTHTHARTLRPPYLEGRCATLRFQASKGAEVVVLAVLVAECLAEQGAQRGREVLVPPARPCPSPCGLQEGHLRSHAALQLEQARHLRFQVRRVCGWAAGGICLLQELCSAGIEPVCVCVCVLQPLSSSLSACLPCLCVCACVPVPVPLCASASLSHTHTLRSAAPAC